MKKKILKSIYLIEQRRSARAGNFLEFSIHCRIYGKYLRKLSKKNAVEAGKLRNFYAKLTFYSHGKINGVEAKAQLSQSSILKLLFLAEDITQQINENYI
jgi:hypothetical protein